MAYNPHDPVRSTAHRLHAQRRAAAVTVAHYCVTPADTTMVLDMLGLLDPSILSPEPPCDLRLELSDLSPYPRS